MLTKVFIHLLKKISLILNQKLRAQRNGSTAERIEFTPSEPLPSGTKYGANFKLGSLIDVDDDFEDFEFAFQTIQQAIFFEFNGLKAVNEDDLNWQKALCKIHTADYVDAEKLEAIVDVLQSNKNLSVYWEHSSDGLFHEFVVDSIQRKETLETVDVSWNSVEIGAKGEWNLKLFPFLLLESSLLPIRLLFNILIKYSHFIFQIL